MLSGPSIANEFAVGKLTAITFASSDKVLQQQIVGLLSNAHFAVQLSDDVLAVELGGILKNIYAFGLGLLKGIEAPKLNFIGAYFTVALDEMQHFMRAKTANAAAILALSGVGDLITTALSDDSHNVQLGKKLAFGEKIENLQDGKLLPEGINTLEVFLKQAEHLDVEMPLAELIKRLAYKQISLEAWQKEFVLLLQK
jgi:glycerol-3-phosphate dehydrogenase (NAD(P)+)